jgi:hypothetical protein
LIVNLSIVKLNLFMNHGGLLKVKLAARQTLLATKDHYRSGTISETLSSLNDLTFSFYKDQFYLASSAGRDRSNDEGERITRT